MLPAAAQETDGQYSYFVAVEGGATVLQGDTDIVPTGNGTGGWSSTPVRGVGSEAAAAGIK